MYSESDCIPIFMWLENSPAPKCPLARLPARLPILRSSYPPILPPYLLTYLHTHAPMNEWAQTPSLVP